MMMKINTLKYFSLLIFLFGCSTTENTLQLESVMDAKAKKSIVSEQAAEVGGESSTGEEDQGALTDSKFDPPELIWFTVPSYYSYLDSSDADFLSLSKGLSGTFPGITSLWRSEQSDVLILAGKTLLKTEAMAALSSEALKAEIEKLGLQYETFYKKAFQGKTYYRVLNEGALTTLIVKSWYSIQGFPKMDIRYTFFYDASYRLNLMITGTERDLDVEQAQFEASIGKLKEKLSKIAAERKSLPQS